MSDVAIGTYGIILLLALPDRPEMAYCMILVGFLGFTFSCPFRQRPILSLRNFSITLPHTVTR